MGLVEEGAGMEPEVAGVKILGFRLISCCQICSLCSLMVAEFCKDIIIEI